MTNSALDFYNQLAEDYHLIFEDWDTSVKRQGKVLDQIIQSHNSVSRSNLAVLDCSCGIGTQAIGLAMLGYNVHATDLSPKAISRAERKAIRLGVNLTFGVADYRRLSDQIKGTFDVIISCDNSLPLYWMAIQLALRNIWRKLSHTGFFLASIRDYDQLLKEKTRSTYPAVYEDLTGKRIIFQVWDWEQDENVYTLNHFIVRQDGDSWRTDCRSTRYRAILRDEMNTMLKVVGFSQINWYLPQDTGYYQPIVIAYKR